VSRYTPFLFALLPVWLMIIIYTRQRVTITSLSSGNERIPSSASHGNVLESINITLNLLHLHYVDRDLHRTGNSIVVITSGNG
jgi:hypothetical protein